MIGDDIAAALPELRAQAESMMVDSCTITRAGQPVWSETEKRFTAARVPVYTGKCRMQLRNVQPSNPEAGGARFTGLTFVCQLPIEVAAVRAHDEVHMDASLFDPSLAGRDFTVTGLEHKTHMTARRLACEEVL